MEGVIGSTLGWIGTIGTFSAYVLIWRGLVDPSAKRYAFLNAAGGLLAAAGAFAFGAWPAVASNTVWSLIGIHGLIVAFTRKRAGRRVDRSGVIPAEAQPAGGSSADEIAPGGISAVGVSRPVTAPLALPIVTPLTAPIALPFGGGVPSAPWSPSVTEASSIALPWLGREKDESVSPAVERSRR